MKWDQIKPQVHHVVWPNGKGKPTLSGMKYENGKVYTLPKKLDEKVARLHLAKIGVKLT